MSVFLGDCDRLKHLHLCKILGFCSGSRNSGERPVLRTCLLCRPTRDAVSSGGDGPERGGCARAREADLASTAAGGHDHPAITGVHCLSALREDTAAGTHSVTSHTHSVTTHTLRHVTHSAGSEAGQEFQLVCCLFRMIAGWFCRNRRSTDY